MSGKVVEAILPCDGCTVCCQGDALILHPECGDVVAAYHTEEHPDGRTMLAHQPNGDCFYLVRGKGCTIWGRRPVACRELDCRIFLGLEGKTLRNLAGLYGRKLDEVMAAAEALDERVAAALVDDGATGPQGAGLVEAGE